MTAQIDWTSTRSDGASPVLLRSYSRFKAIGEGEEGGLKIRAVANSGQIDRDGESIDPAGWTVPTPMPKLLYGHDYSGLPIGKIVSFERSDDGLIVEAELAEKVDPFAKRVADHIRFGSLDQGSVGFDPRAWTDPDGKEIERGPGESFPGVLAGRRYTKQELLEYSILPVPSDMGSVVESFKMLRTPEGKGLLESLIQGVKLHATPKPTKAEQPLCHYCDQPMEQEGKGWVCDRPTCLGSFFPFTQEKVGLVLPAAKLAALEQALELLQQVKASAVPAEE